MIPIAAVVELVDTLVLGANAARREGSSPFRGTILMTKQHTIIYVTGLGDAHPRGQRLLIATWRWWGVRPVLFQMNWADGAPYKLKSAALLRLIDSELAKNRQVSLVGASAGAGAVINTFAVRKQLTGVVCIAGKIHRPEAIGASYRQKNSAFITSAYQVQSSLDSLDFDADRRRILSRYGLIDPIVPKQDSIVPGARNQVVASIGHALTIATQLVFGAPSFIRFLKHLAK